MCGNSSSAMGKHLILVLVTVLTVSAHSLLLADGLPGSIELEESAQGSLSIQADINGQSSEFLLDTGASLTTISQQRFDAINRNGKMKPVGKIAARLASGRLRTVKLYRIEHLIVGNGCEVGPLEVAVLGDDGRNILGLDALRRLAPFTVSFEPPQLDINRCELPGVALSTN